MRKRRDSRNWQGCYQSLSSCRLKLIICPRSLEYIEKECRKLSEKNKAAKVLDKKRDTGEVVKLVEQLRQAILVYQVGTADSHLPHRVDSFSIVVATAVYAESGHATDCKPPFNAFTSSILTADLSNKVIPQRIYERS